MEITFKSHYNSGSYRRMTNIVQSLSSELDAAFERLLAKGGSDIQRMTIEGGTINGRRSKVDGLWRVVRDDEVPIADIQATTQSEEDEARLLKLISTANDISSAGREKVDDGQYGAAISLLWTSLYYERMVGSPFRIANDYGNLGTAYLLFEMFDEAQAALEESLRLYAVANSATGAAKSYYWFSKWYIRKKDLLRAHECARRSLLLFEKHQHRFAARARELLQWIATKPLSKNVDD
jgi:tetratricopeptide (TPR) repeat protein